MNVFSIVAGVAWSILGILHWNQMSISEKVKKKLQGTALKGWCRCLAISDIVLAACFIILGIRQGMVMGELIFVLLIALASVGMTLFANKKFTGSYWL